MSTVSVAVRGRGRVTFTRVVHSEWIKIRSLRSTRFTMLGAIVSLIGLGLILTGVTASRWSHMSPSDQARLDATALSIGGYYLAIIVIGVLGVLVVSGEYSTGMIRATLAAVPRRLPVLWAKALVFAAATWVLMTASGLVAFLAGQAVLGHGHHGMSLGAPGELRAVLGVGLNLTMVGLLAVGVGAIVRNTAGGIAVVFGLMLVLPSMAMLLPASLAHQVNQYLPSNAAMSLVSVNRDAYTLSPWTGFAVFSVYVAVALAAAAVVLKRRDA